jgi:hypothetical protein
MRLLDHAHLLELLLLQPRRSIRVSAMRQVHRCSCNSDAGGLVTLNGHIDSHGQIASHAGKCVRYR